jgi:uncharacterized glyoxalase superfamily protein PhnB
MRLRKLTPMLWVTDMKKTIEFYTNTLGFTCTGLEQDVWAILRRDEVEITLATMNEHSNLKEPTFSGSLYVHTDDVEKSWSELKDKAQIAYPIETFDYGMREFAIRDCNGYIIQFGQDVEELKQA